MKMQRTSINLNDEFFSIGNLMMEDRLGFFSTDERSREMTYSKPFQNAITLEMSFMHREYDRKVYSTLDFLADIGGLFAALKAPFTLVVAIVNFWSSYQFVMADNFVHRILKDKKTQKTGVREIDELNKEMYQINAK